MSVELLPAGAAFDAIAERFDARFSTWRSVAAQRSAVRTDLLAAFPEGARLLEIGGGTGDDAAWLATRGRSVLLTDAAPAMAAVAARKLGTETEALAAEQIGMLADRGERFDGAFSNFAALNCVADLRPVGEGLGRLIRPGGQLVLVVFGTCCPGEWVTEAVRGRWRNVFRRFASDDVPATLSGRAFTVRYHRARDIMAAMRPWFRPTGAKAIGLFVPPSAAEPWISRQPRLLAAMAAADRKFAGVLAPFGDHILYRFERVRE